MTRKPRPGVNPEVEAAYHEAGHAVMEILGCYYRRTPRVVSIVPDLKEGSRGRVASRPLARKTAEGIAHMGDARAELRARDLLMVSLAGGIAARKKVGRAIGLGSDRMEQSGLLLRLADDSADRRAWLTLLTNKTRRALDQFWPAVDALAQALIERKEIQGPEAREIALDALYRSRGLDPQERRQLEQELRKASQRFREERAR